MSQWRRFWAIGTGVPEDYDCSGQKDNESVYFLIQENLAGKYGINDCGTGGDFSNCTLKNNGQAAFTNANALATEETDYACTEEILGINYSPVQFGNSNWGLVGNDFTGWDVRNWTTFPAGCSSDYDISSSGDKIATWDTRNTK